NGLIDTTDGPPNWSMRPQLRKDSSPIALALKNGMSLSHRARRRCLVLALATLLAASTRLNTRDHTTGGRGRANGHDSIAEAAAGQDRWDRPPSSMNGTDDRCFEFLDEYPMAMGCHKSVYRVRRCGAGSGGEVYVLATSEDAGASTRLEAEVLRRASASAPGTVPEVVATCDPGDGSGVLMVQELLMQGKAYRDLERIDDSFGVFSPVARLRVAASGFETARLFDAFPLTLNDTAKEANIKFASGASSKKSWVKMEEGAEDSVWSYEKVFYRDFGPNQLGIDVRARKMKVVDLLSPFYLLYQNGTGVLTEMECSSDVDCLRGFKERYTSAQGFRLARTKPLGLDPTMDDLVNDVTCDDSSGKCVGFDERTLTHFYWYYFRRGLQPLQMLEGAERVRPRLDSLFARVGDADKERRPLPLEAAEELRSIADELERAGFEDRVDASKIDAVPYKTEQWNRTCNNAIGLRQGKRIVVAGTAKFVGACELRGRGHSWAASE
ncbi:hypothetical protein THAOC_03995, partial [Thalassiosira oceanica]